MSAQVNGRQLYPRFPAFLGAMCVFMLSVLAGCGGGSGAALNEAPTVVVTAPAEDVKVGLSQGGSIAIEYIDADPDDVATTDLVADLDGDATTTGDQILIEAGRAEQDGAPQTVSWEFDGVAPGNYKILALTRDAENAVVGTAPGVVALNAPSTLSITEPASDIVVSRGGSVTVEFTDDDPDDEALTWIMMDEDGDHGNDVRRGRPHPAEVRRRWEFAGAQARLAARGRG